VGLEGGKHHEPERASGLEHRTVPRVLRQQRALAFTAGLLTYARTRRIRKKTDFHAVVY